MLGAATRLAYATGLHREATDLRLDKDEAMDRDRTFWFV